MSQLLTEDARTITVPGDLARFVGRHVVMQAEHFHPGRIDEVDETRIVVGKLLTFEWVVAGDGGTESLDLIFEGGHTHREPVRYNGINGLTGPRIQVDLL